MTAATRRAMRSSASLFCMVALASMAMKLGVAEATARLGMTPSTLVSQVVSRSAEPQITTTVVTSYAPDQSSVLHDIMRTAASSLQATYTSINPNVPRFPDYVDPETGAWNADVITENGAAGLLAGSLWSMFKLTGSDMWLARARAASMALRTAVTDVTMGQAMGTLAYPALRYAYEEESDPRERDLYVQAALTAADSLARMFARIPGVLKVQSTSAIMRELEALGVAQLEPMTVLSSVEGSAAATGLLAWASQLPGGKAAWRGMALSNARHIVTDHMDGAGVISGTLIYSALDPSVAPQPLDMGATNEEHQQVASAIEDWLSSVAGQVSSPEMRQALATMALSEALRAANSPGEAAMFSGAVEVTAATLLSLANDPLAMEPSAAAAIACALSQLTSIPTVPLSQRDEYAIAARHVVITLAEHSLSRRGASHRQQQKEQDRSLGDLAAQWLESFIPSHDQRLVEEVTADAAKQQRGHIIPGITQARTWFLRGATHDAKAPSIASLLFGSGSSSSSKEAVAPLSPAILTHPDGRGGSMLGDFLLLQALERLTTWSDAASSSSA